GHLRALSVGSVADRAERLRGNSHLPPLVVSGRNKEQVAQMSTLRRIAFQQVWGKTISGICDECGQSVSGDVGIALITLDNVVGIMIGVCMPSEDEFHPIAQIPISRLKVNV